MMHQAVTLMPCLHNFCGGCFSDWMDRAKDCPSCRNQVLEVKKNSFVNSMIANFLLANPDERDPKWLVECEKKNKFTAESVILFLTSLG